MDNASDSERVGKCISYTWFEEPLLASTKCFFVLKFGHAGHYKLAGMADFEDRWPAVYGTGLWNHQDPSGRAHRGIRH